MSASADRAANQILEIIPLMMRSLAAELRRTGHTLSPSHFRLLAMLYHRQWSLGELAQHESVSAPTISRAISTLEERGWVQRHTSDRDGRVVLAELTPQGQSVLQDMHAQAHAWLVEGLNSLEPDQRELLLAGLKVLGEVVLERMAKAGIDPEDYGKVTTPPQRGS